MLADLAEAIVTLDIAIDGDELAEVLALRDRLDARIAQAVAAFDAASLWDLDAATSMTAWLRSQAGMTSRSARHLSARAVRLRRLPVCTRAFADGSLSGGQVDAILAGLDDTTAGLFAESEAELVPYLAPLTVSGCARAMAAWRSAARPDGLEPSEPERAVHLSRALDDRWVLDGSLDAEGGATVDAALRLAAGDDPGAARLPSALRADALVDVCRHFLDHQRSQTGGRHRPHLNVVVDLEALQEDEAGGWSTGRRWTGRPCPGWSATAPFTGW